MDKIRGGGYRIRGGFTVYGSGYGKNKKNSWIFNLKKVKSREKLDFRGGLGAIFQKKSHLRRALFLLLVSQILGHLAPLK